MSYRASALRLTSLRLASKRLYREAARRATAGSTLSHRSIIDSPPAVRTSTRGFALTRFWSSNKCPEHEVENCSKCAKEVTINELTELMQDVDNLRLVDVREAYELRDAGQIPHAVNIPLTQLKGLLSMESDIFLEKTGLPKPTKADSIVFYGMGSIRSVAALEIACKMGYKKARHYPGGWQEWSKVQQDNI